MRSEEGIAGQGAAGSSEFLQSAQLEIRESDEDCYNQFWGLDACYDFLLLGCQLSIKHRSEIQTCVACSVGIH